MFCQIGDTFYDTGNLRIWWGGNEVKEIAAELSLWDELVFIDDTVQTDIFKGIRRMPFEQFCNEFSAKEAEVVISLGEPAYKEMLRERVEKAGFSFANIIHKTALVSPSATLGRGVTLRAGAIIQSDAVVGDCVTIMEYSGIGHDTVVEDNVQIAAGVFIGGRCRVGKNTYIATGVPVKDSITIGNNSVIGIGSVVSKDIPENVIAVGNPARAVKHKDDRKVF
jgi:sugar O-acyltransferase (sialic acid O-acetyltransferase NeuD family)